jgi:hypothetical protein
MSDQAVAELLKAVEQNEQVRTNEDGTKTVVLSSAVKTGSGAHVKEISEVTFRKPKGRDWRETDKETGDLAKAFRLASCLSDLPMSAFDSMEGDDALLCATIAGTMGKKLKTGGT